MYSKILVAIDESELSQQAFKQGLYLAQAFDAELQLLIYVFGEIANWLLNFCSIKT